MRLRQHLVTTLSAAALTLSMTGTSNAESFLDDLEDLANSGLAFRNGDAISFSYQFLVANNVITSDQVPFTPQGKSPFVRLFTRDGNVSNAHLNPNINDAFRRQSSVVFDQDGDEAPSEQDHEFNFNH
ncbi:MAG: hypothetical protein ACYTGQ_05900, partial [Planctomycetota bacterium]